MQTLLDTEHETILLASTFVTHDVRRHLESLGASPDAVVLEE